MKKNGLFHDNLLFSRCTSKYKDLDDYINISMQFCAQTSTQRWSCQSQFSLLPNEWWNFKLGFMVNEQIKTMEGASWSEKWSQCQITVKRDKISFLQYKNHIKWKIHRATGGLKWIGDTIILQHYRSVSGNRSTVRKATSHQLMSFKCTTFFLYDSVRADLWLTRQTSSRYPYRSWIKAKYNPPWQLNITA